MTDSMSVVGRGVVEGYLTPEEVSDLARQGLERLPLDGKRVLVLIPDGTRTMPMPLMFEHPRARARPARGGARLSRRARHAHADERRAAQPRSSGGRSSTAAPGDRRIFNHRWDDPATFATLGTIPAREIDELSLGRSEAGRAGRAQPAGRRVRPRAHLRPGVSARGRRLLGRHEVPLPGHRRARDHPLHALAGRAHHELRRASARSTRRCAR